MTRESMSKSAMNEDQALQAIKEEAGAQFDPNLSAAFIEMMGQG
jgi:response regulator RpfG family c-di-GMP phosphodiesterase